MEKIVIVLSQAKLEDCIYWSTPFNVSHINIQNSTEVIKRYGTSRTISLINSNR